MRIYGSAEELIGHTPLVELKKIEALYGLNARLLAKVESFNPAGSVKDRAAKEMLDQAERDGRLSPGATVIEPTSGNTGIALCALCALRGYRALIVMPDTMSQERRRLMKAYGAELVLTDGKQGMAGAVEKAEQLRRQIPGSILAGQFVNPANTAAHYKTTGPELVSDTDGQIDWFVAGVGTGGTVTGTGRYLKEHCPGVKIVAVEPASSPLLSQGKSGAHGIQGIGANFIPDVLDRGIFDEIFPVTDEDSFAAARQIARREGLLVGISAGAALHAAVAVASRPEAAGKTVVTLLPDTGDRYLSTELFSD